MACQRTGSQQTGIERTGYSKTTTPTELEAITYDVGWRGTSNPGCVNLPLVTKREFDAGDFAVITLQPDASDIGIVEHQFTQNAELAEYAGDDCHGINSSDGTNFTYETDRYYPGFALLIDQLDDGSGGGGGVTNKRSGVLSGVM